MRRPEVSIVVPTYGRSRSLSALCGQLKGQTFGDWECLVGIDGDDDRDSLRVVGEVMLHDARFKLVRVEGGPHGDWGHTARAVLLPRTKGRWVCFLNDDAIIRPVYLERLWSACQGQDGAIGKIVHESLGIIPERWDGQPRRCQVDAMSGMVRGDWARAVGWIDRHYEADWTFYESITALGARWGFVDEVIGEHR